MSAKSFNQRKINALLRIQQRASAAENKGLDKLLSDILKTSLPINAKYKNVADMYQPKDIEEDIS